MSAMEAEANINGRRATLDWLDGVRCCRRLFPDANIAIFAEPQDLPDEAEAGKSPEAEQTYPAMDPIEDW